MQNDDLEKLISFFQILAEIDKDSGYNENAFPV
jgi:hypothetical protein